MDTAFGWLGRFMDALGSFIPRLVVVKTTHAGVSFVRGKNPKEIRPGLFWYWPVWTDYIIVPVVRQSLDLPSQTLTTNDDQAITVAAVIVYEVNDVMQALTTQWDLDETLQDISCAAVREYVVARSFKAIQVDDAAKLRDVIRKRVKRYGIAVRDAWVTDFARTKVITVIGSAMPVVEEEEE